MSMEGRVASDLSDFNEKKLMTTKLLPWDRFSSWIHCICIVTFDLELGQAMEVSLPTTYIETFTNNTFCHSIYNN
jgi:Protein of unknown function (DUF1630).